MCGIFGTHNLNIDITPFLKKLEHRGPDNLGIKTIGNTTHGHVRLSVIDTSPRSNQPYVYLNSVLSFNGEIWNYKELKNQLINEGYNFKTTSDTEVLIKALDKWGIESLNKIDGMFCFVYTNIEKNINILARDPYGKIPIYISKRDDAYIWSSERKTINQPWAILPPGTYFDFNEEKIVQYYNFPIAPPHPPKKLHELLRKAVKKRMVSDVPLCCLISGGLDSSYILKLAQEQQPDITAYTAYVDENNKDLFYARKLCQKLNIQLTEIRVESPTINDIKESINCIELSSKAQIEIALLALPLAKKISEDGFKVVLSGEGADELFGGYGSMCIPGSKANDEEWRNIRLKHLDKMSRGNFVRCNKIFMKYHIECRLPFMDRGIVESVLNYTKSQCPPNKKLLKETANEYLPKKIINRPKLTFQGGSGMSEAAGSLITNPTKYYNQECKNQFKELCKG